MTLSAFLKDHYGCIKENGLKGSKTGSRKASYKLGGGIKKTWPIHTKDYYSALRRKEILTYVTTWRNHGDIMLSEIQSVTKERTL